MWLFGLRPAWIRLLCYSSSSSSFVRVPLVPLVLCVTVCRLCVLFGVCVLIWGAADVRGDQQRQRYFPVQRDGRHVAPVAVQSHPACGHLRPCSSALLLLHHSDHPHQLHPHDHAAQRLHRIHWVSLTFLYFFFFGFFFVLFCFVFLGGGVLFVFLLFLFLFC